MDSDNFTFCNYKGDKMISFFKKIFKFFRKGEISTEFDILDKFGISIEADGMKVASDVSFSNIINLVAGSSDSMKVIKLSGEVTITFKKLK